MKSNMTKEETCAYLGGIIDGEGCVQIGKSTWNGRFYYRCQVEVTSTDHALIFWLHDIAGGSVGQHTANHAWKEAWRWTLSASHDVLTLLNLVLPYSIIKEERIKLAIRFICRQKGDEGLTHYNEMKVLNKKCGHQNDLEVPNAK